MNTAPTIPRATVPEQWPLSDSVFEAMVERQVDELELAKSDRERAVLLGAVIGHAFGVCYRWSRAMPAEAKAAFESMDWNRSVEISRRRIVIYTQCIDAIAPVLCQFCRYIHSRDPFWALIEGFYLERMAGQYQVDLAYAFLNSVRRKVFQDQWEAIEYSYGDTSAPTAPDVLKHFSAGPMVSLETVREILELPRFSTRFRDLQDDAQCVAERINRVLELPANGGGDIRIHVIHAGFYRNRGAYVVGRIETGATSVPLAIALLNEGEGIFVDAVILDPDHLQYVFSSTLANFHVTSEYYHELSAFLHELMPKRPLGLHYSTIGFNHVGKITVMGEIEEELARTGECLMRAPGFPGTVAIGVCSPSSEFVLEVIRDRPTDGYKWGNFPGVEAVLAQYSRVHEINRTGSMLDNVIYHNITLPRASFSDELLGELLADASLHVSQVEGGVVFKHLIVQMKMSPLPLFLETATGEQARAVVHNLGQCIKNNAAANIFNKDLDGRNYGDSKILKVYLFDYDALMPLTDVCVHSNRDRFDGEEDVPDWFFEDGFVFLPEEMEIGLRIHDRELIHLFRRVHGDLLTLEYWTRIQDRPRQGRVPRIHTYPSECRL